MGIRDRGWPPIGRRRSHLSGKTPGDTGRSPRRAAICATSTQRPRFSSRPGVVVPKRVPEPLSRNPRSPPGGHHLPRGHAPHGCHAATRQRRSPQTRPRIARARQHRHNPGHLLSRAAGHGRRPRRHNGRGDLLAERVRGALVYGLVYGGRFEKPPSVFSSHFRLI